MWIKFNIENWTWHFQCDNIWIEQIKSLNAIYKH